MKISKEDLKSTPEEAGYLSERLDVLDNYYIDTINQERLQCAVYGLARKDKVIAVRAMGKKRYDDEESDTVSFDSIRRIASMTKLFTAVAIMKLVEDGKLRSLNCKVAEYIKEFDCDGYSDITPKHLLSHTSGLPADSGVYFERYPAGWNQDYNWIQSAMAGQPRIKPGEFWSYCSMGYAILGELIKRVTGVDGEAWITDNIIKPLGMTDTYFDVPEEKWGRIIAIDEWSDPYKHKFQRKGNDEVPRTGWGIYSTASDLLKFGQMLCNNGTYAGNGARIISRKAVETLREDCGFQARDYCWGAGGGRKNYGAGCELYGLNRRELLHSNSTYGHEGAGYCGLFIDPDENFVMVYFIPNNEGWQEDLIPRTVNIAWSGLV